MIRRAIREWRAKRKRLRERPARRDFHTDQQYWLTELKDQKWLFPQMQAVHDAKTYDLVDAQWHVRDKVQEIYNRSRDKAYHTFRHIHQLDQAMMFGDVRKESLP